MDKEILPRKEPTLPMHKKLLDSQPRKYAHLQCSTRSKNVYVKLPWHSNKKQRSCFLKIGKVMSSAHS